MEAPDRPVELLGRPAPDVSFTDTDGRPVAVRDLVRRGPLVLFFYIRNGTPG